MSGPADPAASPAGRAGPPSAGRRVALGIDVGGTFVDCVVTIDGRVAAIAKRLVSDDPVRSVIDAVDAVAAAVGGDARSLLSGAERIVHGTTSGLNALLTGVGDPVGLLTTRGHEDALLIGRVHQKVAGLGPEELIDVAALAKPEPLVPRWRTRGIDERIDAAGEIVVPLDEDGVRTAIADLVAGGCKSLAVSFLWSFRNPAHERRVAAIAAERYPELPITLSSDIAPVLGEYERTAATVVNARLRSVQGAYLARLEETLARLAFGGELRMFTSAGGAVPARAVRDRPVETLRSGPVGGVTATARLGARLGRRDLLATDVGGTSFDVGLVVDGRPDAAGVSLAGRLHVAVPAIEVRSIGAGGGSIAWVDPDGGLHVGPASAGANPGPACYGRGGTEPTVTDADLLLGRLNPGAALGEGVPDRSAAEAAMTGLARRLGVDVTTAAAGVVRVLDARMADLVRRVTVQRGVDPRRVLVVAYGGAAGLHVGAYAFDAGAEEVVLPEAAAAFSAVGLASAGWRRVHERSGPLPVPLDAEVVAATFELLEGEARRDLPVHDAVFRREIDFRFRRQTHQLTVALEAGPLDRDTLSRAVEQFERDYDRVFGPGTGYAAAGIEATAFRLLVEERPLLDPATTTAPPARPVRRPVAVSARPVYFDAWVDPTPVHDGASLVAGDEIVGPAVIDWPTTTLVVRPGQVAVMSPLGHVHLRRA